MDLTKRVPKSIIAQWRKEKREENRRRGYNDQRYMRWREVSPKLFIADSEVGVVRYIVQQGEEPYWSVGWMNADTKEAGILSEYLLLASEGRELSEIWEWNRLKAIKALKELRALPLPEGDSESTPESLPRRSP